MTALGMMALHLRIADFKFTHNFVICNRLPDTEIIFGIDIQKKFSISYVWDTEKNCYIQRDGKFLTYMQNCEQKATIGILKSSLKIPPRHNGVVPIKITGQAIKDHIAYFITDENSTKSLIQNHMQLSQSIVIQSFFRTSLVIHLQPPRHNIHIWNSYNFKIVPAKAWLLQDVI